MPAEDTPADVSPERLWPVADVRATQRLFAVIAEEDPRVPWQTEVAKGDDPRHSLTSPLFLAR